MIKSKPKAGQTFNSFRINGTLSTNRNQIASSSSTFFCNIPKEIEKNADPTHQHFFLLFSSFSCYLADAAKEYLFMISTDEKEIRQKTKAMKDNKDLRHSRIRIKIHKVHSKALSKPLAEMIFKNS